MFINSLTLRQAITQGKVSDKVADMIVFAQHCETFASNLRDSVVSDSTETNPDIVRGEMLTAVHAAEYAAQMWTRALEQCVTELRQLAPPEQPERGWSEPPAPETQG